MRLTNERGGERGSHGKEVPKEGDGVISASPNASLEVRGSWGGMPPPPSAGEGTGGSQQPLWAPAQLVFPCQGEK